MSMEGILDTVFLQQKVIMNVFMAVCGQCSDGRGKDHFCKAKHRIYVYMYKYIYIL